MIRALLALPMAAWFVFFLLLPLGYVALFSFYTRGAYGEVLPVWTLDNYARLFDPLYLGIYARSARLALLTTVVCVCLGLPLAYVMATASKRWRGLLLALLMVPFLTNFVVRVYAIRALLGVEGPFNALLLAVGWRVEPLLLNDTPVAVAIGMITTYLPFMVLPIYVVLEKLDFSMLDAARDLGASGMQVLRRILIPLAAPGLASGCTLVFVPCLGEFMIPDLLGGARTMLVGNLLTERFLKSRDWPFGAALTMLLLITVVVIMSLRIGKRRGEVSLGV